MQACRVRQMLRETASESQHQGLPTPDMNHKLLGQQCAVPTKQAATKSWSSRPISGGRGHVQRPKPHARLIAQVPGIEQSQHQLVLPFVHPAGSKIQCPSQPGRYLKQASKQGKLHLGAALCKACLQNVPHKGVHIIHAAQRGHSQAVQADWVRSGAYMSAVTSTCTRAAMLKCLGPCWLISVDLSAGINWFCVVRPACAWLSPHALP